jgi:mycofactocin precursor
MGPCPDVLRPLVKLDFRYNALYYLEYYMRERMFEIPTTTDPDPVSAISAEPKEDSELDEDELVLEDLLVEDVSIDGMCGVY